MKRLVAMLLTLLCLIAIVGCNSDKNTSSKTDNVSNKGSIVGGVGANAEYIANEEENVSAELTGSQALVENSEVGQEIVSTWQDAYKINNMSGGSDAQAETLRNKILTATDDVKVIGTKYYFSSINGNDENDGLSPSTPLKSLASITKLSLNSGDAILLERGSVFRLTSSFNLKSGVTYAAYGQGDKPAIYGSSMNYAVASIWQPFDKMKNVWVLDMAFSGDAGNIVFNHGEAASNKIDYVYNMTQNGDFYYDSSACKLYLYLDKGNPGKSYSDIEISPRFPLFNVPSKGSNITIDNITFKYSGNFAIYGGNVSNIKVTNCEIAWIGGAYLPGGDDCYGNGIEFGGILNSEFKNNWVYQIYDSGMTFQHSEGDVVDVSYSENLFEFCGMSGFEWWKESGVSTTEWNLKNISFDNNIVRFTGYGWISGAKRGARHIQGPFRPQDYPNMENFVFIDNIFDCAQGGLFYFKWNTSDINKDKLIWKNNTYFQKKTESGIGSIYGYGEDKDITYYATNQSSLESAVKAFESSPKLVKWLE